MPNNYPTWPEQLTLAQVQAGDAATLTGLLAQVICTLK